ncbi:hypothetical protein RU97_GL002498 [Enterococcus canis]|uniref:DUF4044 domain-containing protein n=1 Tax=Enterococcus canis TaxID=214095 RepID=A0A1L8RD82_9ENTE|nr:DUF4044 domain-containing protein [Enterococcus canis]OJG17708.1 hypothetical protein RU97_GL002498 [Enterococcus canis]
MNDKKMSRFQKITKVVVWLMLIVTIGSAILAGIAAVM